MKTQDLKYVDLKAQAEAKVSYSITIYTHLRKPLYSLDIEQRRLVILALRPNLVHKLFKFPRESSVRNET